MVAEIDIWKFSAAHADGALVLDVREPEEYASGHVPGARLIPLSTVSSCVDQLPTGRPIFVICQSGNRSRIAAEVLAQQGRDARSVIGGTSNWIGAGRPIVRGVRENRA